MQAPTWSGSMLAPPMWAKDFGGREHILPVPVKIDTSQFRRPDAVLVKLNGAAAVNDTSITVDALSGAVPSGTTLHFGSKKFVITTAAAIAGATTIAVEAVPTIIADNDEAYYAGTREFSIPSGTFIGRTIAERDAATAYGPAATTDDEVFLTMFEISNADLYDEVEVYRPDSLVAENYLPKWTDATVWTSGLKATLRARYQCIVGED